MRPVGHDHDVGIISALWHVCSLCRRLLMILLQIIETVWDVLAGTWSVRVTIGYKLSLMHEFRLSILAHVQELAAMANAIVRQSSRQPFLHRHDGGTASSSQSPSSSGEPANQPQQQAASINMPMQPHARSAGLTSRQKPLPRQLAADVGQTEPGPATGDKVMSLHQQCLPARQAPQVDTAAYISAGYTL